MSNADFSALPLADLPLCADLDMRIARDGTWYYRGSPINRKPLVKLFSTVLRREDDGAYWLVTPAERGRVAVDDAPFTAVEVSASGSGADQVLRFRTNLDDEVTVGAAHPLWVKTAPDGQPSPYVRVRPPMTEERPPEADAARMPPGLDALILRPVYYHLVELGAFHQLGGRANFGVWSGGVFFPLGTLTEEE